ncbi:MAG: hypothetical protein E6I52_23195 [Chloroflexi bacterium]|nr:MAG: hypothetical protein E6I52_23195 [Chloroflexota bacterium]
MAGRARPLRHRSGRICHRRRQRHTLARAVARYPARFIGFAHHNPFRPGAADKMRRAVNTLGLRGLKILAPALERRIDDRDLYPPWEAVEELGVPVQIHSACSAPGVASHGTNATIQAHWSGWRVRLELVPAWV